MMRLIALAGCFSMAQCLAQTAQELPQDFPPIISSRCGSRDPQEVIGGFRNGFKDSGRTSSGATHFIHDGELWVVNRNVHGQALVRPRPLPAGSLDAFTKVCFRDGVLYQGRDRTLMQSVEGRGWKQLLAWGESVGGTEVDAMGYPILLGTSRNLVEVYEPGGTKPIHAEPYPEWDGTSADRAFLVHCHRSSVMTCQINEWRVIYFPDAGRLYAFDSLRRRLKELRTPWRPLDPKGLQLRAKQAGGILLDGIPSATCLELVPLEDGAVGIGYQVVRQTASITMDPVKGLLLDRKQDRSGEFVHWVEVDLGQGSVGEVREYPEFQLPVWKDPLHGVVALQPWRDAFSRGVPPVKPPAGK